MKPILLCLCLVGCVTARTAEGEREITRDAIHARHTACFHWVESTDFRGRDAMGLFRCDFEERRACIAAGLEPMCGEWQTGGL